MRLRGKLPLWVNAVTPIFNVTDLQQDPDDEDLIAAMGNFTLQGAIQLFGMIANLAPAEWRTRLLRRTLDLLGMDDVPVGQGTDCNKDPAVYMDPRRWNIPYLANVPAHAQFPRGKELFVAQLRDVPDRIVTLLGVSGLTDIATLLEEESLLVEHTIRRVVMMGGVIRKNGTVVIENGLMVPDDAANNNFDMDAAKFVYRELQVRNIPMTVLTKEAAYAVPFPRSFYDELAKTGHPVGIRLRDMQKNSIEHLWYRSNLPAGDSKREGLPERCDRQWFSKQFLNGEGMDRDGSDSIWDIIHAFYLYDPMAGVAAIERYGPIYYEPDEFEIHGTTHRIIGMTHERHNVKYPEALRGFIHSQIVSALDIYQQAILLAA